jgi:1-acyl-sn-glycerol-3-phosphate acyltransferase
MSSSVGPGGQPPQTPPKGQDQPKASRDWSYSRGWRAFTVAIVLPLSRLLIRFRWQGKEYLPRTGGVILAPNHLSYADWPAMAVFSYLYGHRFPVFMIKSGIFEVPLIGPLMYKDGQLPVYRGRGDAGLVLRQAEQALAAGACVIVYPEGTASRDPDLWPMLGKTGAARLALTTGAPVIPIGQWGAQDILPYGSKKPKLWPRKTVQMTAGPPVDLSAYAGQRLGASTLQAATADIMADITTLLAEIRKEAPPAEVWDPAVGARRPSLDRTNGGASPPAVSCPSQAPSATQGASSPPAPSSPPAETPTPADPGPA